MENIKISSKYLREILKAMDDADAERAEALAIVRASVSICNPVVRSLSEDLGDELVVVPCSLVKSLGIKEAIPNDEIEPVAALFARSLYRCSQKQEFKAATVKVPVLTVNQLKLRRQAQKESRAATASPQMEAQSAPIAPSEQSSAMIDDPSKWLKPPRGKRAGTIPWHQNLATKLGKLHLSGIFRKQVQQRIHPYKLGAKLEPQFEFVGASSMKMEIPSRRGTAMWPAPMSYQNIFAEGRGSSISNPLLHGFELEMSTLSERCYFLLADTSFKRDLTSRFDYYHKFCKKRPDAINVYITELCPEDTRQEWFKEIAAALKNTQVRAEVKRWRKHVAHNTGGIHAHVELNGLTAAALAMKAHGDIEALVRIFAYAPVVVASDMRNHRMGAAFGTVTCRCLLSSIMKQLSQNNYTTNQSILIQAAVDVMVAYMGREDHHEFVSEGGKNEEIAITKLRNVLDVWSTEDFERQDKEGHFNYPQYLRMAAMRDGIAYASVYAYARDLDAHNEEHVKVLATALDILPEIGSAAAGIVPGGGVVLTPVVKGVLKSVVSLIIHGAKKEWEKDELEKEIDTQFDEAVVGYHKDRFVAGIATQVPPEFKEQMDLYLKLTIIVAKRTDSRIPG